jgi:hypothetical protein
VLGCLVYFSSSGIADVQILEPKIQGMKNVQFRPMRAGDLNTFFQGCSTGRGEL